MKVRDICRAMEEIAPLSPAAEWDNVGLLIGDPAAPVRKMILCIDLTEAVVAEVSRAAAQMVMAYHPVIFKPISRLTPQACPSVFAAARKGLAVYSAHTALDVAAGGTNDVLAAALDLRDRRPLEPQADEGQCKIVVFLPVEELPTVAAAAFGAGAGVIGDYRDCSFFSHGIGTFCGGEGTAPAVGQPGRHEAVEEVRLEMVASRRKVAAVCQAVRQAHSYEEPAIDVYPLLARPGGLGPGRVGRLGRPVRLATLIGRVKKALGVSKVLLAGATKARQGRLVDTVAVAAGSCGSLWRAAVDDGASVYLTGEMRHHDALAASAAGLDVICVGHSHSERLTLERLAGRLGRMLPKLKVVLSRADRDPFDIV